MNTAPPSNGHPIADTAIARQFEKLPPHSIDAEMCLLASMMLDKNVIRPCLEVVTRDAFFSSDHQVIFDTIVRLDIAAKEIDAVIVRDELRKRNLYEEVGGDAYIGQILGRVPSAAHGPHYAGIIADKHKLRRLLEISNDIIRSVYAPHEDADSVITSAAAKFADATASRTPVRPVVARDMIADYPELCEPTIAGLLRVGEVGNVIAAPKMRKSWLVMSLLLCFVSRRAWLGMFATAGGKALLIDNELHPSTIAHRLPRVAEALGIMREEWDDQIHIHSLRGRLVDLYRLDEFIMSIKPGTYRLVVLDALYRLFPADMEENSNGGMCQIYNVLDRWAAHLQCSIVVVHHSSKGVQGSKSVTDTGAGAGAQSRAADAHIILREHEDADCAVMDGVVRSWEPLKPIGLRWAFPIWTVDDELDVTRLKKDASKGGRPRKGDAVDQDKPQDEPWTVERFVAAFVTSAPRSREAIESNANRAGLTFRAIAGLIAEAEESSRIHVHKRDGSNAKFYATVAPTLFTERPHKAMNQTEIRKAIKLVGGLFPAQLTDITAALLREKFAVMTLATVEKVAKAHRETSERLNITTLIADFESAMSLSHTPPTPPSTRV